MPWYMKELLKIQTVLSMMHLFLNLPKKEHKHIRHMYSGMGLVQGKILPGQIQHQQVKSNLSFDH